MKKKRIHLIALIIISVLLYLFVPAINKPLKEAMTALSSFDLAVVVEYIRGFGPTAAAVSFSLMILQALVAPIPAFFITLSNAIIWGWVYGAMLSWSSATVAAGICFYIARLLGREPVEKLTGKKALESTDHFFEKYGKHTILVCRLLPFVSFDLVSYAAGLTSMRFLPFIITTGIGQLPATLFYSYVAGGLFEDGVVAGKALFLSLTILFAVSIIVFIAGSIYKSRQKKRAQNEVAKA